ncbi:MAG: hypothetical protein DRP89_06820 [Candidatus Neomarinimicrobiota bacterium]|nr:MAG: hypothetical protein DRP89_06820 [Candidatus Neomarinimicrobiota bacterium]
MVQKLVVLLALTLFVVTSCDKGLAPPEAPSKTVSFPIVPEGGNPVGVWEPDTTNPVDVTIIDKDKIPSFIDSLIIESNLNGVFSFSIAGVCSLQAVLTINPIVYLPNVENPLVLTITDTLRGDGPYEVTDNRVLDLPVETSIFQLDTLGFTSRADSLTLISLPNTFPQEGFSDIRFFFVFHLIRSTEGELP